jgi:predicted CoA-binding protein
MIRVFSESDKLPSLFQSFLDIELEQANIWLRAELEAQRASSSVYCCSTATFQALNFDHKGVTWL